MDPDLFHDDFLGFSLKKPTSWIFVPPLWSPIARLKNIQDPSVVWAQNANTPFCCAIGHQGNAGHAPSAVQVTARPPIAHSPGVASTMLESQLLLLHSKYPDFVLLMSSSRTKVSERNAIYICGTFRILTVQQDPPERLSILSRLFVVFARQAVFTIGLSGSSDPGFYLESDFEQILSSVNIGP